jgi:hypothetical protein
VRSHRWNHRHSFSHSIPLFFSSCDAPLYLITSSFIIINHHHHPLAMALSKALFVHYGLSPQTQSPRLLFNHNSQQQQQDRSSNIPTQQGLSSSSSSSSTLLRRWGAGMNGVNAKLPLASTSILRNTRGSNGRVVVFAVAAGVPVQSPDGQCALSINAVCVFSLDCNSGIGVLGFCEFGASKQGTDHHNHPDCAVVCNSFVVLCATFHCILFDVGVQTREKLAPHYQKPWRFVLLCSW